ncbi:MAG TPA: VWA domain-containing protein [Candidatus Nanoarchaeia archaeon]|nr:VWA domain-containing protein [Candidatus Nanoarchaeia archaeon]
MSLTFTYPEYLWLLLLIPVMVGLHFFTLKLSRKKALEFANFEAIERFMGYKILSKNLILLILRLFAILFIIMAIVGINYGYIGKVTDRTFIIAIDSSGSMLATDYNPNRFEAGKEAAINFVDVLPQGTEIGLVSFSGSSLINAVPTIDKVRVTNEIKAMDISLIGGTAIGDVMITSGNLLLNNKKSKIIVLLTDGQSNVGASIEEGVSYLNGNNIVVDTIGIGSLEGGSFVNYNESVTSKLDEEGLKFIAERTNGKYFRAVDKEGLDNAYKEIAEIKEGKNTIDLTFYSLILGLIILLIEWLLINTKFRTLP